MLERDVARHVVGQQRSQRRDKHELKPMAREFMERALKARYALMPTGQQRVPLPSGALEILAEGNQANSTANNYAPYVRKWGEWCNARKLLDFPPDQWNVAMFLIEMSAGDKPASPTLNRRNAISWACAQMNLAPVTHDGLVLRAVRGIQVQLGIKGSQKEPILPEHIRIIYSKYASAQEVELSSLLYVMMLIVMFEATLRYDDLSSVSFWYLCRLEGAVLVLPCNKN